MLCQFLFSTKINVIYKGALSYYLGVYVYAEASSPVQIGQVTKLQSKTLPPIPKGRCIQFAYNMYGSGIGALNVYVIDAKNGAKSKLFSMSGDQGQGWHRTNATIVSNHYYKVIV